MIAGISIGMSTGMAIKIFRGMAIGERIGVKCSSSYRDAHKVIKRDGYRDVDREFNRDGLGARRDCVHSSYSYKDGYRECF